MLELLLICAFGIAVAGLIVARIYSVVTGIEGYEQMATEDDWGNQDVDRRMER